MMDFFNVTCLFNKSTSILVSINCAVFHNQNAYFGMNHDLLVLKANRNFHPVWLGRKKKKLK